MNTLLNIVEESERESVEADERYAPLGEWSKPSHFL